MEPVPFDKRSGKIWFNGQPVNWSDVKIHVLSHGLHYASCVFEGERVYDGEIFKLEEHTERLFHSASRLGFEIPYSEESLNKISYIANPNLEELIETDYITRDFTKKIINNL